MNFIFPFTVITIYIVVESKQKTHMNLSVFLAVRGKHARRVKFMHDSSIPITLFENRKQLCTFKNYVPEFIYIYS